MREYVLRLREVTKRFGGLKAVDGVSFDVRKGTIVGVIGPNGSGKTTLFNLITGVYRPDGGEIYFEGKPIHGLEPHRIYRMGLVRTFQIPRAFYRMTVLDNVILAARDQIGDGLLSALLKRRRWRKQEARLIEKAMDILEFLGLHDHANSSPASISGGQLRLLELARALISDPKMILLDEPASGIAPSLAKRIFGKIMELRSTFGITFLIIEHRLEYIMDCADWVLVLHKGRIIGEGRPYEVMESEDVLKAYLGEAS
ncbi:MAG: ABC transporter ATP-binding protein [Thermoprotei archaeon]|nr:ABC transporter ATP-binding protein [Thermoprotei archaeon]